MTTRLILGDCLEVMKTLADGSVDAVVTDPPYGNATDYVSYQDTQENLAALIRRFMPHALRVGARIVITCGVPNMWFYPRPNWVLAWTNPAGVGSSCWGFSCWQPILVYGRDPFLEDGAGR